MVGKVSGILNKYFKNHKKKTLILLNSSISGSLDLLHTDGPHNVSVAIWDGIIPGLFQPVFITTLEPNISRIRQEDMLLLCTESDH